MNDSVFFYAAESYEQIVVDKAVARIFDTLPAFNVLNKNSRVLLKPNLLAKKAPEAAVTTHPAVVRAVIRQLKCRGVSNIILADSCGGLYNPAVMKSIYRHSGILQVCEEENVSCFTDCTFKSVEIADGILVKRFNLLSPVVDCDFIVNLAKFKTHVMTGCTAATKNLFGCVPGMQKAEFHARFPEKEQFGNMLIDLMQAVRPNVSIVDGIIGMEGDGPSGGTPRKMGILLAGENPLTIDLAICEMMGLDSARVPYLKAAQVRGLCGKTIESDLICGDSFLFKKLDHYKLPASYKNGDTDFSRRAPSFLKKPASAFQKYFLAPRPKVNKEICIACGKCAGICPQNTIKIEKHAQINPKHCIKCFCCHEMCPVKAIDITHFFGYKL